MEIYLIRHTKPKIEKGICYGQSDMDVADSFEKETKEVKEKLPEKDFVVFTSPLKRCSLLARKLFPGKKIIEDERIKELNFGDWEMKKWDEIDKEKLGEWTKYYYDKKCPNGECHRDLNKRVMSFFNEIIKQNHESIVLVTHSGVIRSLLSQILETPPEKSFSFGVDFGSITKLSVDEEIIKLEYLNK